MALVVASVAGCGGDPAIRGGAEVPAQASKELRIEAGDTIRLTVFGEEHITGEYDVDDAGAVSVPLAGTVHIAGLTKPEAEHRLAEVLAGNYLRDPKVTVSIANFRRFFILGEVEKPGEYQYRPNLNVLSAIAIAGGTTYRASKSYILIQRAGSAELIEFPQTPAVAVLPGDLVRVPERFF